MVYLCWWFDEKVADCIIRARKKSWMLPLRIVDGRRLIELAWEEQLFEAEGITYKAGGFGVTVLLAIVVFLYWCSK